MSEDLLIRERDLWIKDYFPNASNKAAIKCQDMINKAVIGIMICTSGIGLIVGILIGVKIG